MERGVLTGAAGLRWAAWIWLTIVALVDLHRDHDHPLAIAALAVTGAVTVAASVPLVRNWPAALHPAMVGAEVAAALFILLADGWVDQGRAVGQTLSGQWPIPAILVAAVAGGLVWGSVVPVLLGGARIAAVLIGGSPPGQQNRDVLSALSTSVEWVVFGVMAAVMIGMLHRAQEKVERADARERVARHLHDGVLQTLALIERRTDSTEIAALARDQERDLRAYLFSDDRAPGTLGATLQDTAARFQKAWPGVRVTVSVSSDASNQQGAAVVALCGAATEALTNAAKHGGAKGIVLFADIDDSNGGLFSSVKDDGSGFDLDGVTERVGMAQSIRGRVEAEGGRVEFRSVEGEGAEVRMWVPVR